jgi:hypothetical protein
MAMMTTTKVELEVLLAPPTSAATAKELVK